MKQRKILLKKKKERTLRNYKPLHKCRILLSQTTCQICCLTGFPEAQALGLEVFHSGTALKDGKVVTNGGRVLTVTAIRENVISALEEAKKGLAAIKFEGAIYRRDIGFHAIAFLQQPR